MRTRQATTVCALAALLAACGGRSPAVDERRSASSETASGTITGIGTTLTVDGVSYDVSGASVSDDADPANPTDATLADLQIGQRVDVTVDPAHAHTHVAIDTTLIGLVDPGSIDTAAGRFTVLAQTVEVTASGSGATLFVGIRGASGLKDGRLVKVHGPVDSQGIVHARLVVVMPEDAPLLERVRGIAQATDAAARTFKIGNLTVAYADAKVLPTGAAVADGEAVVVYSRKATKGTAPALTLRADTVHVLHARRIATPVRVGGKITSVTPVAGRAVPDFTVDGLRVDCASASLADGTAASALVVGALVLVEGTVSDRVLTATRVAVLSDEVQRHVVLFGQISSFTGVSSFVVRGTTVDATSATYAPGSSAAQLADGVLVSVLGHVSGAVVIADQIMIQLPPRPVELRLAGIVSDYDAAAGMFELAGLEMKLDPAVAWTGGTAADLADGKRVEVTGTFDRVVFDVKAVRFLGDEPTPPRMLTGVISAVTADSFVLNNVTIAVTASTEIVNGPLQDGQPVLVLAKKVAGGLEALRVQVGGPRTCGSSAVATSSWVSSPAACRPDGLPSSVTGPVSKITGAATFEVDGQAVDAAGATFRPAGTKATDLAVGRIVAAYGPVSGGVLHAVEVILLQ